MDIKQIEQTLYIALRFKPEYYGIVISHDGWVSIGKVIERINFVHGYNMIDKATVNKIVKNNPKFEVNTLRTKIKANKTEEKEVQKIKKTIPPDVLYYICLKPIDHKVGIKPNDGDQYVVLKQECPDNYGPQSVLKIDSRKMFAAGYVFFLTDSGDVLTATVGPKFITGIMKGEK